MLINGLMAYGIPYRLIIQQPIDYGNNTYSKVSLFYCSAIIERDERKIPAF